MWWKQYDRVYHKENGITGSIVRFEIRQHIYWAQLYCDDGHFRWFDENDLCQCNRSRKTGESIDRDTARLDWALG